MTEPRMKRAKACLQSAELNSEDTEMYKYNCTIVQCTAVHR